MDKPAEEFQIIVGSEVGVMRLARALATGGMCLKVVDDGTRRLRLEDAPERQHDIMDSIDSPQDIR